MATNITESIIELTARDNQLMCVVDDQGFLRHLAIHYIDSTFELQHAGMRTSSVSVSALVP